MKAILFKYVKHLRRGPTSTIIVSNVRSQGEPDVILSTQIIDIGDSVQVLVKFLHTRSAPCQPFIAMKTKSDHNSALPVTITCDKFDHQFFCSNEWVEIKLNPKSHVLHRQTFFGNAALSIYLYTIEINLTLHNVMPATILPNRDLYENPSTTDFQLRAPDGAVVVHKEILFLYSHMFKMISKRDWKAEGRIHMDGITVHTLRHLKEYMYLGTLPTEGLQELLQLASYYSMDKLRDDCSAKLVENVSPENFDRVVALACEYNVPELVRGLIFRLTDDVVSDIYDFKYNEQKWNDNKSNNSNNSNNGNH